MPGEGGIMERFDVDPERLVELRAQAAANYPANAGVELLPGSVLKIDDQIFWLGFAALHVVAPAVPEAGIIVTYGPESFGDIAVEIPVGVDAEYISDRAPADPAEQPMPIYPDGPPDPEQQMQQAQEDDSERQMGGTRHRHKATLQEQRQAVAQVLAQLTDEQRAHAAAKIREKRPELVAQEGPDLGDHRHNAVPPPKSGA